MAGLARFGLAFVAALGVYFMLTIFGGVAAQGLGVPSIVLFPVDLVAGFLAGRFVWRRLMVLEAKAHGLLGTVGVGALVTGGVGFVGGFFGPIILTPDANQGPLLGIFITGPLGFVLGGLAGVVVWFVKRGRAGPSKE